MSNTIILKRSSTAGKSPTTSQLALGEIAINTTDGKIFIKKDNGVQSVVEIGGVLSVNGHTGTIVLGTDDVAEGSSNQFFTTARARSALSASTGISYNSGTGAISTVQNIATTATPTFAGLTLTGDFTTKNLVPSASNTYDLGSAANPYRHIFVGPGSLYVNGKQVLTESSGTMTFSADLDQNIRITTTGTGLLQFGSSTTGVNIDGTMQIAAGKRITSSDGVKVQFGDDVELNGNKVIGLGSPTATTDAATKGYVDTAIGNVSTTSISQGNSSVQVVDTGTGTVTVTVDGNTALSVTADGVVISGNMTVNGTTTTVNSNTIALADNIITLNSDTTGVPTQNAGVEVNRGDEAKVGVRWNEGSQKWTFTNDGATYQPVAVSTTDLAEGTNQYFTTTRARGAVSASSSTGVSYNSTSGAFSLGSIPNTSLTNNSITVNTMAVALGGSIDLTTDYVQEGASKQYFTTARARTAVSADGSLAYNSTTGVFSYTTPTTIASLSNHTTTGLTEGTNLYFTDARAVSANASTVTAAIATAASDATSKVAAEATARATAVTAAIATAASDATSKVAAEASARDAAITAAIATKDNSDEITEGTTNLYFTSARAIAANTSAIATAVSTAASDATSKVAAEATARDAAVLVETNARVSAVTSAISTAASDATSKVAAEATARATAVTAAIATAASDATSKVAAEATARDAAIATNLVTAKSYTDTSVASLVATAPAALDTLKELATALGNDANFATSVSTSIGTKLATADFASTFDTRLATKSTTNLAEGTNLYYTDARAKAAITAGTGITVTSGVVALASTTTTIGTTAIALGASSLTLAGLTSVAATTFTGALTGNASTATTVTGAAQTAITSVGTLTGGALGTGFTTVGVAQGGTGVTTSTGSGANALATSPTFTTSIDSSATFGAFASATALTMGYTGTGVSSTTNINNAATASTFTKAINIGTGALAGATTTIVIGSTTGTSSTTVNGTLVSGAHTVTGAITATGEVTAYYSDANLKKDVVAITDPIAKVMALRGVTFRPNDAALALGIADKEEVGVIAQEVEAVLPQLVVPSAFEGYKTVKYDKLTALLLEAVKAQQAQIEALTAQVAKLSGQ